MTNPGVCIMDKHDSEATRGVASFLRLAPSFFPLTFKALTAYARLRSRARKAGRVFEDELVAGGMRAEDAKVLSHDFVEASAVVKSLLSFSTRRD